MAEKILMIALSPTMEEGTIGKWTKKEGDVIKNGDIICEVETDKATMDYESIQEGTLLKIIVDAGKQAKVGDLIGIVGKPGEDFSALLASAPAKPAAVAPQAAASAPQAQAASQVPSSGGTKASPLARKIADEKGINISSVEGSGPGGRVVKRDLENASANAPATKTGSSFAPAMAAGQDIIIPVTTKRGVIAKRLSESLFTAPHIFLTKSVEADNLMNARAMLNKEVDAKSKVSFNAFTIKLAAEALKRYPEVNSSWQGDKIIQYGSIDIGLAVDLGNGLITPIIRNAGNKGIVQIDQELKILIDKVANNALKPDEFTGATFTISNLGSFGIEEFTAIINPPGSAILALGEVKKVPVVKADDSIGIASVMKMTLSIDHRNLDGALGGKFLNELGKMIENPVRVLF